MGMTVPRAPLLVLGVVSLAMGILAGLGRLGWPVPAFALSASAGHGALMASAFLGTVIGLERAVALGSRWGYLAPLLSAMSGVTILFVALPLPAYLGSAAAAVFFAVTLVLLRRQPSAHGLVLLAGAACGLLGNVIWLIEARVASAVWPWLAFLLLTIVGERLELSRYLPPAPFARRLLLILIAFFMTAMLITTMQHSGRTGLHLQGISLVALAVWLMRYDIVRRTLRQSGLPRFVALCLFAGYGWLAVTGVCMAFDGPRDTLLHAFFIGFVFSMIFGHAPIIFPAVLRIRLPFHGGFYLPLLALHATLLMRVIWDVRLGGLGNALAIVLFILTMAGTALAGSRR